MKKKQSLLAWIFILTVGCVLLGVFFYYILANQSRVEMYNHLRRDLDVSLAAVNPERIKSVSESLSDESADFLRLREQLVELGKQFEPDGIDSVYSLKQSDDKILFLVDSLPYNHPDYGPPGEEYLNPPLEVFSVFLNGQATFVGPYADEYGEFYSYFKPIRNLENNKIVSVLGIDIKTGIYLQGLYEKLIYYFGSIFIFYVLTIVILIYIHRFSLSRVALSNEKFMNEGLINALPNIFYLFDAEYKVLLWNNAIYEKLGFNRDELKNMKFIDLFTGKNIKIFENSIKKTYDNGHDIIEAELKTKQGNIILFEFYNTVFRNNNGEIIGIAGSGYDISIRHKNELDLAQQKRELENMNNLMIGREGKMVELKKDISNLRESLNIKK